MRLEASFIAVQSSNLFAKKENSLGTTTTLPKTNIGPENGWSENWHVSFFGRGFSYSRWFCMSQGKKVNFKWLHHTSWRGALVTSWSHQKKKASRRRIPLSHPGCLKVAGSENDSKVFQTFHPHHNWGRKCFKFHPLIKHLEKTRVSSS